MRRTYYSDYCQHSLRYYARYRNPQFHSDADRMKWESCDSAMKNFSAPEKRILLKIYGTKGDLVSNILSVADKLNVPKENVFQLAYDAEDFVAKARNLV